jgi:putative protease
MPRPVPELLSPAGSLDAARAAIANGANAIYLGAEKFNARDDGAQLTMDDLEQACRLAHAAGVRVYLTFNVLFKPAELRDALWHLGECIDRGIDAAIVQDIGAVRLIQQIYPGFEIHGSTQMTVHDSSGARVMQGLGIDRVVLARENTLDDIRAIRAAVPELGLESFVHGALCIAYSGQCFMSGMISERSANRGSCAQSCRKDYVLSDTETGEELDRGYLISAKDLGAWDHLADIAEAGIGCLKVEGRKKKPEYVATVTQGYREFLDRVARGEWKTPTPEETQPLVQIFSRGFTGGMYGGRQGRDYVTRNQPDNRGFELGKVTGTEGSELVVAVTHPIEVGDGLGFEHPDGASHGNKGFAVTRVRTISSRDGLLTQAILPAERVSVGWTVVRSAEAGLLSRARISYSGIPRQGPETKTPVEITVSGSIGAPLSTLWNAGGETVRIESSVPLAAAERHGLDTERLQAQLGRLGETPFVLDRIELSGLAPGLFLPVSILNDMRQRATETLNQRRSWVHDAALKVRRATIEFAVNERRATVPVARTDSVDESTVPVAHTGSVDESTVPVARTDSSTDSVASVGRTATSDGAPVGATQRVARAGAPRLVAEVWRLEDAIIAADAGAEEISLDLFIRHPTPPVSRVRALREQLAERGVALRLRTPTIVRPEDRKALDKWLALETPLTSGHLGLVAELSAAGRDVVADYAVNAFNQVTAAELFRLGAKRIVLSVELTGEEMAQVAAPWQGENFDIFVYGRPEGMTIEHCVLSAAYERIPTTCRDLCVQKHHHVTLTDPSGYPFPVATDSDCRNRLLHSRPVDGSDYLAALWRDGFRTFRLVFNVPGDPVAEVTAAYRQMIDALAAGHAPDTHPIRAITGREYTRGHFATAV